MLTGSKNHGADKILFASDCPWSCPLSEINLIEGLGLSDAEKEMIYYKNAERLLEL
ncbi:MAG TPA: amidohydrolase family protein [Oscillospiraceae bacterium]|nr:amidohydrolase family protein [Oscillospiraceae bacterium]